jgi:hypothetical protein
MNLGGPADYAQSGAETYDLAALDARMSGAGGSMATFQQQEESTTGGFVVHDGRWEALQGNLAFAGSMGDEDSSMAGMETVPSWGWDLTASPYEQSEVVDWSATALNGSCSGGWGMEPRHGEWTNTAAFQQY